MRPRAATAVQPSKEFFPSSRTNGTHLFNGACHFLVQLDKSFRQFVTAVFQPHVESFAALQRAMYLIQQLPDTPRTWIETLMKSDLTSRQIGVVQ